MRARSGQCVSMVEISQILSRICGSPMTPEQGSRSIVNGEFHTVHFVEDVSYQMLYGVARLTREQEKVSGDNYICRQEEDGRFFLCLSDGMGSGMEAFKESEIVVELLEQFMESGLSQETAARMVNSALLLKGREGMFSTVDICAVDLYTGICNFLKAGASSTFIKRDHWWNPLPQRALQQVWCSNWTLTQLPGSFIMEISDHDDRWSSGCPAGRTGRGNHERNYHGCP